MRLAGQTVRAWTVLLAAPLAWFAHFGFVYAVASLEIIFAGSAGSLSRWIIAAGTLAALAGCWWGYRYAEPYAPDTPDARPLWIRATRLLAVVSGVAVLFQAAPALLVP